MLTSNSDHDTVSDLLSCHKQQFHKTNKIIVTRLREQPTQKLKQGTMVLIEGQDGNQSSNVQSSTLLERGEPS